MSELCPSNIGSQVRKNDVIDKSSNSRLSPDLQLVCDYVAHEDRKKRGDTHEITTPKKKLRVSLRHDRRLSSDLVGNSNFGFRFLGRPESGIPLPSSEFQKFPAENKIRKPENRSSRKSEFRFRFFRNSGIPLITYIGTLYYPLTA